MAALTEKMKSDISEFAPKVPLLVALRKPGMEARHWKAISEKCGKSIKPDEEFTFTDALNFGLL